VPRRGEQEVQRVLHAIVEAAAVAERGRARDLVLELIGRRPELVGVALALGVEGQDEEARLGQRLGLRPVRVLETDDRAVVDDDPGRRAGPSRVAQRWPESVAPLREVKRTGATMPLVLAQVSSRGSPTQVAMTHALGSGARSGSSRWMSGR
jgi:hypothetical protein